MRIFGALVIMVAAAFLWLLPAPSAADRFPVDFKTENYVQVTPAATSNVTFALFHSVYQNNTSTLTVSSNLATDVPVFVSYTPSNHSIQVDGLTANTTRTLTVGYDVDALTAYPSVATGVSKAGLLWYVCIIAFVPAAIIAIFIGRA